MKRSIPFDDANVLIVVDSHDIQVYADPRVFIRIVRRPEGAEGKKWDRLLERMLPVQFSDVYVPHATRFPPRPGKVKVARNDAITLDEAVELAKAFGWDELKRRLVT